MRGEDRRRTQVLRTSTRITPACAGKTRRLGSSRRGRSDHPRMRGEDRKAIDMVGIADGSPPHARGRRAALPRRLWTTRITPACAGKTSGGHGRNAHGTDHPRMRGEDIHSTKLVESRPGSPPHARGRHMFYSGSDFDEGITPACAGKTRTLAERFSRDPDHPRMRGEDLNLATIDEGWAGSPPHARGRRHRPLHTPRRPRITPACAGKTPGGRGRRVCLGDHPRMRGEDS